MSDAKKTSSDCCGTDDRLMTVDEVLARIGATMNPVAGQETVPLGEALGRLLAADQVSPLRVPSFDNSAVDGWAVDGGDLNSAAPTTLPVGGRIAAGRPLDEPVRRGLAYRIFTGAPLPPGLDTVLTQETCRQDGEQVTLPPGKRGANARHAGESVEVGDVPLTAGTRLRPQHIGVAAMLGLTHLPVRRRLRVAIFSTGDEVREPGQPLPAGCIYDANRYTLAALLAQMGCMVSDLGILEDRHDAVRDALEAAAADHDLVITSGGVSVGEEDHVKAAIAALGSIDLWRVAVKPGKPLAVGRIKEAAFLGLPGNPVAVMVTFLLFGRPLIGRLCGAKVEAPRRYLLPAGFAMRKNAGRREFPRARVTETEFGPVVELFRSDSSGVLTSVTACDGLVDLRQGEIDISPGDLVEFLPFSELLA